MKIATRYTHLACEECGDTFSKSEIQSHCKKCMHPLTAAYDLTQPISKNILIDRPLNMWRYKEVLPIEDDDNIVSLGEGMTDILPLDKLAKVMDLKSLSVKDESGNPTGSFKARGLSMAVSKAKEFGISEFCIPTAGNAGSALSAYVAKINGIAHVYMPQATPEVFKKDCAIMGSQVNVIPGSIKDAGVAMKASNIDNKWWDVTTLKEPFRLEGKKLSLIHI